MPSTTITFDLDITAEDVNILRDTVERQYPGRIMPELLKRTRNAEDNARRDRLVAAEAIKERDDLREQIGDAKADADATYQTLTRTRAEFADERKELTAEIQELRERLARQERWLEEERARLVYVRRQLSIMREDAERHREDEAVSAALGRNVVDLPF